MNHKLLLIVALLTISQTINAQGKLDRAQKSLQKEEKEDHPPRSRYSRNSNSNSSNSNTGITEFFVTAIIKIAFGATYGLLIEMPEEKEHAASTAHLTKYPYHSAKKGNFTYEWGDDASLMNFHINSRFVAENGKLYGNHFNFDFHFIPRMSVEFNYLQLWEESVNFEKNSFALYTFLGKYHRVRTEKFNLWWGLGFTYADGFVDHGGFAYGLGAEAFIARPLSLELTLNQSFINDEDILRITPLLNYHYRNLTFFGGFEHLKIGNEDFSLITAGLGITF
ncbi:hypothetical protein [Aquimarina brevivitae]|uniref:Outer membrane protein with beta-barrel domain n=1 Tax=Aquimarina brevivitae TaxID=323412 RepID=A0A4Q7PGK5_9FLAO|nr:hypothetical protein [Aquimarina brevivitae]RZS99663.1 hypothetical protein EV197_0886 [Aquimarina brevivitae]